MRLITLISLISFTQLLMAQDDLDRNYNDANYPDAIKTYKKYLKKADKDSLRWYRLGISYKFNKQYDEAIESLQKAIDNGFYRGYTNLEIARIYAISDNESGLFETLETMAKGGATRFKQLKVDSSFAKYQSDDKFLSYVRQFKENAYPCLAMEKASQFDFWIGTWDVYVNNRIIGENRITKANGGCAMHESYITPGAYTGQSINFVDPKDNLWKQYWVGSSGDIRDYVEKESSKGKIVFVAEYDAQGTPNLSRMTFTHNPEKDEVRQYIENSTDNGKTWAPSFDGMYKKQKAKD